MVSMTMSCRDSRKIPSRLVHSPIRAAGGLAAVVYVQRLGREREVTPEVTRAAPALTVAVELYNAEQYPAALRQLSGVVAMLHQARQAYPALPPL
jgi:hypothetical protein